MRMRSTGLGKTEVIGRLENIKLQEIHLIFSVRTTEPVKWHVRVAIDYRDIKMVLKQLMRFSTLNYLFRSLTAKKEPKPPSNY